MILDKYKTIYYRGYLRSCNYTCYYCPFSKNKISSIELEKDRQYFLKFIELLKTKKTKTTLFIAPYGEALIHEFYLENIVTQTGNDNIKEICIQTNGSFELEKLLSFFSLKGDKRKLVFWISYHPTEIAVSDFYNKCISIHEAGLKFSVGAVADYKEINNLKLLREKLPKNIYMWINKKDESNCTQKEKYTNIEYDEFKIIDPYFGLELKNIKSDFCNCEGSKTNAFINYKGDMFSCNLNKKSYGNIYTEELLQGNCNVKYCSCYLAYSNRTDIEELNSINRETRIPICLNNKTHTHNKINI